MTLDQLIALLSAIKTEENKDLVVKYFCGFEMSVTVVQDDGLSIKLF